MIKRDLRVEGFVGASVREAEPARAEPLPYKCHGRLVPGTRGRNDTEVVPYGDNGDCFTEGEEVERQGSRIWYMWDEWNASEAY